MNFGWLKTVSILSMLLLAVGGIATADNDYGEPDYIDDILLWEDFDDGFPPAGWEVKKESDSTWKGVGRHDIDNFGPVEEMSAYVEGSSSKKSDEWLLSKVLDGSECNYRDYYDLSLYVWILEVAQAEMFDLSLYMRNEEKPGQEWEYLFSLDEPIYMTRWNNVNFDLPRKYSLFRLGFRFYVPGSDTQSEEQFATALDEIKLQCRIEVPWSDDYDNDNHGTSSGKACFCGTSNGKPGPYLFVVMLLIGFLAMLSSVRGRKN
jgi:hypothetical protein